MANEALTALPEKGGSSGINHALIIGISNYDDWEKLESPARDAAEIYRILTEKYDFKKENVILLTDLTKEKPTRETILTYLEQFVHELTEKDNLLIFFSGHCTEDEKGETYWIPKNGKKDKKFTWLEHTDICDEYLGSESFKAKNVCILADSVFTKKVLKPTSIVLSPYDLRYPEKIMEKAQSSSRELMAFNDRHWPGSKTTDGYGLFTYYLRKGLLDNWLKVIDIENLLFEEDAIFQIQKISGTRLLRGRLKNSPMEKEGQTVLTRIISPPVVNIVDAFANPKKGFVGDRFIIEAKTSSPAFEVYCEVGGKQYVMEGSGTEWKHAVKLASLGTVDYSVIAINSDDIEGKPKSGNITTLPLAENMVNVTQADVNPKKGVAGEDFSFHATTDVSASGVTLVINEKRFEMTGSDKTWSLSRKIEDVGTLDFSIAAKNQDGLEGRSKGGVLVITPPKVNIVTVEAEPEKGYSGDAFIIKAGTDFNASSVSLIMDKTIYAMEGSGKEWTLKKNITEIGKKKFTIVAKNSEGVEGLSRDGELLVEEMPLGIPDIVTVAVSPKTIQVAENFIIKVKTSEDAEEVVLELAGKKYNMEGAATDWRFTSQLAAAGTSSYKITAANKNNERGTSKDGEITIIEKIEKGVDVASIEISPKEGIIGETFDFKAVTSAPAQSVSVVIGEKRFDMTGSGTNWSLKKKIDDLGAIDFYVVAKNKEGKEGTSKDGTIVTKALITNIAKVEVMSDKGYVGEEFQIKAVTDQPASSVTLKLDGVNYKMEGSGTNWAFKKKITETGKKSFTITAQNLEGKEGKPKSGEITAKLAIPDVTAVTFDPEKIFAGDSFTIKVKTSTTAEKVFVEIDGKRFDMQGADTEWRYMAQVEKVGDVGYKVHAQNNQGAAGLTKEGKISFAEKPKALINVAKAEVSPGKGYSGGKFTFGAITESPAQKVILSIGGENFEMTGSGTEWTLSKVIEKTGEVVFSVAAVNEDETEGVAKTATLIVEEIKMRYEYNPDGTITDKVTGEIKGRFVDNGDGSVTDLATNLMWLKEPKRVASDYDEADEFCRGLSIGGKTGWRLPTIAEWKDIIDEKQENPALPPGHPFININTSSGYWSKTKHKFGPLYVYQVNLWNGKTAYLSKKKIANVWAVRYSETGEKVAEAVK
ncbi:MAG: DUF1566 domain-containing protein [Deltaproteobacteria bacterium]|nr:DUF1566 domain-containing protein [Deltaproteobacteria bacterium]